MNKPTAADHDRLRREVKRLEARINKLEHKVRALWTGKPPKKKEPAS